MISKGSATLKVEKHAAGCCRWLPSKLRTEIVNIIHQKEDKMLVKNVKGSSRYPAPFGYSSWLEYWKSQTGQNPYFCAVDGCARMDLVGAHVQKAYSADNSWYIVPICSSCNQRTDTFNVNATLVPVPSNL